MQLAKNYSYNELMKMQEDAINRVREMQKRATIATQVENRPPEPENLQKTLQPQKQSTQSQSNIKKDKSPQHKSFTTSQNPKQTNRQQGQACPYHSKNKNQNFNRKPYKNEQKKEEQNVTKVQKPDDDKIQSSNKSNPLFNLFGSNFGLGNLGNIFGGNFDLSSIMGKLGDPETGDQILIIGLLILLSSEGADKILLLALLYIMID